MRNSLLLLSGCVALMFPVCASAQQTAPPASAEQDPVRTFLSDVEGVVELHDWLRLLDLADSRHREAQLQTGMGHAQYVAELLGLNYEGNTLQPPGEAIASEHLNRIRQISWKRRGRGEAEGVQSMLGTVTLSDGSELLIEVQFVRAGEGYRLTGARG